MKTNLNRATFVGIDAHRYEHTAYAMNRFEEEKGWFNFENTQDDIANFTTWLTQIEPDTKSLIVGIEGGGCTRNLLINSILNKGINLYEVNPLFTKQRRSYGTNSGKSDKIDAQLVSEVLTRKLNKLPLISKKGLPPNFVSLRKYVRFYEDLAVSGARCKNKLKLLNKEHELAQDSKEKKAIAWIIKNKKQELKKIERLKNKVETKLDLHLKDYGKNLTTVKGIATVLAARLVVHTRSISGFANIDKYIKYAGIAPVPDSSGKSKHYVRNKGDNRNLNSCFYMVALNQLRWNNKAKEYFEKKVKEGKSKKHAMRCLMKRIACIVYGMMKSGEDYRN